MATPLSPQPLFDPARHEPLTATPWNAELARAAIRRIAASAELEFERRGPHAGSWRSHPLDEPKPPDRRAFDLYMGAGGVIWALRDLASQGAIELRTDFTPWIAGLLERNRTVLGTPQHGTASFLCGDAGLLLLQWSVSRDSATADALHAIVTGNLHNTALEALWGNPGTVLAAIHMAEATGQMRWMQLVQQAVQVLLEQMQISPDTGTWAWRQDLYGRTCWYLGGGHGFAGNVFPALRAADMLDAVTIQTFVMRAQQTLEATALHGEQGINWAAAADAERVQKARELGYLPLVQDCHGAPGIICRLATVPRDDGWDALLRGAGELTWHAGPVIKGSNLCHGTAGSALACLKLWRRFRDDQWLDRARRLAMHAIEQCERHRTQHGMGRHSLWTGDPGLACVLWNCLVPDDRFPTLDHF